MNAPGVWWSPSEGQIEEHPRGGYVCTRELNLSRPLAARGLAELPADAVRMVPDAGHLDLDDVLQRHRNVARALSENGTSEETLQGWHAFAGWLRNGMPDEPDVRGDVPDTGVAVSPAHVWFVPEEA